MQATKRTGWIRMGVDGPESIADHMYRMSLMALIGAGAGIDQQRRAEFPHYLRLKAHIALD